MSFFKEMAQVLGYTEARLALGFQYVNYNGEAVYIEGVKRILRIDENEMAFGMPHGVLKIFGSLLTVAESAGAGVLIRGKILGVETSDPRGACSARSEAKA